MNGIEVVRELRYGPIASGACAVIVTAGSELEIRTMTIASAELLLLTRRPKLETDNRRIVDMAVRPRNLGAAHLVLVDAATPALDILRQVSRTCMVLLCSPVKTRA